MSDDSFRREAFAAALERRAPRMDVWRVLAAFTPSAWGTTLALVGVASMLPGLGLGSVFLLSTDAEKALDALMFALLLFGGLSVPPAAIGLVLAAISAGRRGARAVLLLVAAGLLAAGGTSCGVALELPSEAPPGHAFLWGSLGLAGLGLVLAGLGFLALVTTPGQIRRELADERRKRAVQLLLQDGSVPLAELQRGLGTDEVQPILDALPIAVRVDAGLGQVTTAERVARRHGLLLATIEERRTLPITELADLLREPPDVVRCWIDELVTSGSLDAAVTDGTVQFKALRPFAPCGGCGGPIAAVGGQVGRCVHCGSEAYSA